MDRPYDRNRGQGSRGPGGGPGRPSSDLNGEEQQRLEKIVRGGDAVETIRWADELGQKLVSGGLTTSQLRSLFGEVRQIQQAWPRQAETAYRRAVLLIPKIGYQTARATPRTRVGLEELQRVMVPALELVAKAPGEERKAYFGHFVDLFEALIAYHRKHGGREQ